MKTVHHSTKSLRAPAFFEIIAFFRSFTSSHSSSNQLLQLVLRLEPYLCHTNDNVLQVVVKIICRWFTFRTSVSSNYCGIPLIGVTTLLWMTHCLLLIWLLPFREAEVCLWIFFQTNHVILTTIPCHPSSWIIRSPLSLILSKLWELTYRQYMVPVPI